MACIGVGGTWKCPVVISMRFTTDCEALEFISRDFLPCYSTQLYTFFVLALTLLPPNSDSNFTSLVNVVVERTSTSKLELS